jgi:hypothetical protein
MALALPLMFTSCNKDDEISLPGTEWTALHEGYEINLKFLDKTKYQVSMFSDGERIGGDAGTYTLSGSSITISSSDGEDMSGTVKGNKMTLIYYEGSEKIEYLFTKK